MKLDLEWLESVLKEKEAIKGMVRLLEMSCEPAAGAGENFNSSINRVQLAAVLADGKTAKKSLILKRKPEGELLNVFLDSHYFFQTEIKMYTEVLPAIEEILREQGVPPFWPEFFGLKDNVLICSDLKDESCRSSGRKTRLELAHILLVVCAMAHFHAASVVLRQRGLLDLTGFQQMYFARRTEPVRRLMTGGVKRLSNIMAAEWGPEWSGIADKLQKKADTYFDDLTDLLTPSDDRLNVLCHGDLWNTNLLFKYSQGSPIGVKFVDFQLSHYNSYVCDLHYFMACSITMDLWKDSRTTILEEYTRTLRDSLTYHGYPELAPTLAEVKAEMSRTELLKFGFMTCCRPVVLTECADPLNFDALLEQDGIAHNPNIYREISYKEDLKEELIFWEKVGLF